MSTRGGQVRITRAAARLLVLAALGAGTLGAGTPGAGTPGAGTPGAGTPGAVPSAATSALDGVLAEQFARSPAVPGIVARVDAPGLRWERAVGKADRAAGTPLTTGTTFRIASVTKTFTAAAVLTLVDQRRVTIDAA